LLASNGDNGNGDGDSMGYGHGDKVVGDEEGYDKSGKSRGVDDKDGRQAMGIMAMAMATTRAMTMVMRWGATNRVMARAARAMATAMRMAGNKEVNGKGGKSNGNGNEGGGQQRGQ
jgi:hypothetical protein